MESSLCFWRQEILAVLSNLGLVPRTDRAGCSLWHVLLAMPLLPSGSCREKESVAVGTMARRVSSVVAVY